jgi:hypothetical protein
MCSLNAKGPSKNITRTTTVKADKITPSGSGTKTTFTQNVVMNKALSVTGATKLDGGLTMDTNKFVVANGTGNTSIAGILGVTGAATFNNGVTIINGKKLYINEINPVDHTITTSFGGNILINNNKNLDVTGNVNVDGNLTVSETTTLNGSAYVQTNDDLVFKDQVTSSSYPVFVGFSPNGNFIATVGDTLKIFSVNSCGSLSSEAISTRLISYSPSASPYSAAWSPIWSEAAGGLIAVAINSLSENNIAIFRVDIFGNTTLISTVNIDKGDTSIAWAPLGNFVAVAIQDIQPMGTNVVQTFSVDTEGNISSVKSGECLTGDSPNSVKWAPAWSLTSGGFIILVNSGSDSAIQTFSVDTSGNISAISTKTVGNDPRSVDWSPNWSNESGGFVAVSNFSTKNIQVFTVDGSGNLSDTAVSSESAGYGLIAWAPTWDEESGGFIAIPNDNDSENTLVQIFSIDISGNISQSAVCSVEKSGICCFSIDWSKIGNNIVLVDYGENSAQIFRPKYGWNQFFVDKNGVFLNDYTFIKGSLDLDQTLGVNGAATFGQKRIFGQKKLYNIGTSLTDVLTLNFNQAQDSTPYPNGARVKVDCFIYGIYSDTSSLNYYSGDYYIDPTPDNSSIIVINEQTRNKFGVEASVSSNVSGTDKAVKLQLSCSPDMTVSQSAVIFYEVISDNIESVS